MNGSRANTASQTFAYDDLNCQRDRNLRHQPGAEELHLHGQRHR